MEEPKEEPKIKYLDPLTDEQKEAIFDVKIEYLTPKEILEKYGDLLTKEQKIALGITESEEEYEPYFGWCDVDGCENEGANGGGCWRETGYWTVCSKHSSKYRAGEPQPPMKQTAIDREKRRGADGVLVNK